MAEDSVLLGCDAALLGNRLTINIQCVSQTQQNFIMFIVRLPTFQGIVSASYFEATGTAHPVKQFNVPQEQILQ